MVSYDESGWPAIAEAPSGWSLADVERWVKANNEHMIFCGSDGNGEPRWFLCFVLKNQYNDRSVFDAMPYEWSSSKADALEHFRRLISD
ncbi:hypothetical protein AB0J52_01360 [Spirillospora sp. NPDC049652]